MDFAVLTSGRPSVDHGPTMDIYGNGGWAGWVPLLYVPPCRTYPCTSRPRWHMLAPLAVRYPRVYGVERTQRWWYPGLVNPYNTVVDRQTGVSLRIRQ